MIYFFCNVFNKVSIRKSYRELGVVDRFLWLLVVLAALSTAAVLTQNFWAQWKDEQVFGSDNIIICRHLMWCMSYVGRW